jgi:hypothetical protein
MSAGSLENRPSYPPSRAVSSALQLMFVQAKVVFASRRTMQVLLHVWSETASGELRLTDRCECSRALVAY